VHPAKKELRLGSEAEVQEKSLLILALSLNHLALKHLRQTRLKKFDASWTGGYG
jgi:hypothetical protein